MIVIQGVLLYAALAWKLYQLSRDPRDTPLRAVTACLTCAALAYPFGVAAGSPTQPAAGPMPLMLAQYTLLLGVVYALNCFFLFAALESANARRRALRESIVLGAAVSVLVVGAVLANVWIFYVAADLYLGYGLGKAFLGSRRYARDAEPRLARGLLLTSVGLAAMSVASLLLMGIVIVDGTGATAPSVLVTATVFLLLPGILLFIVGISYPGVATRVASLRVWRHHLRCYHQLGPLWTMLHEAFPEDALNRSPLGFHGVHRRYYRRVIECRDGLVRISPYLARTEDGPLAHRLVSALRAHAAGETVTSHAVAVALPSGSGLDADVQELVVLSQSLRKESN